jgi:hypothetical protein
MVSICCSPPTELLAAVPQALFQAREGLQHALVGPVALAARAGAGGHFQVLDHAQVAEDAAALGHVGHAELGDLVRRAPGHGLPITSTPPRAGLDQAHDGFQQRALAHAVAAHQADGFAARTVKLTPRRMWLAP